MIPFAFAVVLYLVMGLLVWADIISDRDIVCSEWMKASVIVGWLPMLAIAIVSAMVDRG